MVGLGVIFKDFFLRKYCCEITIKGIKAPQMNWYNTNLVDECLKDMQKLIFSGPSKEKLMEQIVSYFLYWVCGW